MWNDLCASYNKTINGYKPISNKFCSDMQSYLDAFKFVKGQNYNEKIIILKMLQFMKMNRNELFINSEFAYICYKKLDEFTDEAINDNEFTSRVSIYKQEIFGDFYRYVFEKIIDM